MRKLKSPYVSIAGWGIFLAGALSLASCSVEDLPSKSEQGEAIKFGQLQTRAGNGENSTIQEIGVFAQMNLGSEGTEKAVEFINLLDNERVYLEEGNWKYDKIRYWINDRTFLFFAYYPYVASNTQSNSVSIPEAVTLTGGYAGYKVGFETPSNADVDFMTAYKVQPIEFNATTYPLVDFQFKHALSKICINVAKPGANKLNKIVVKSVTLQNVNKDGFYTSRFADYDENWVSSNPQNFVKTVSEANGTLTTEGVDVLGEGNEFLLIPQEITGSNVYLSIKYDYYDYEVKVDENGDEQTIYKNKEELSIGGYLPKVSVKDGEKSMWNESQRYTYKVTLAPKNNDILFSTPTVDSDNWSGHKQIGGTIIIQ